MYSHNGILLESQNSSSMGFQIAFDIAPEGCLFFFHRVYKYVYKQNEVSQFPRKDERTEQEKKNGEIMNHCLAERLRTFEMKDHPCTCRTNDALVLVLRVRTSGKWSMTCVGDLYEIIWGDGTVFDPETEYHPEHGMTYGNGNKPDITTVTHTFMSPGYYKLYFFGRLLEFGFSQTWLRSYLGCMDLIACISFGNHPLLNLQGFHGHPYLETVPHELPKTVQNLDHAFRDCTRFNCPNVRHWDVSHVTSLAQTFRNAKGFNQDIGRWDVSNVTSLEGTFMGATSFDQNLDRWNTESVERMDYTFSGALRFDGNIGTWKTSKVRDMCSMFSSAERFNGRLENWDTSSVQNMHAMFFHAKSFDQEIGNWNTMRVVNMNGMFSHAISFNRDIRPWDTRSLITAGYMFHGATRFRYNLSGWTVPRMIVPGHI